MIYIVSILLFVSVTVNLIFWWYIREYLKRLSSVRSSLQEFQEEVKQYQDSISGVLSMDIYAGEPTIETLVNNTKVVLSSFEELDNILTNLLNGE